VDGGELAPQFLPFADAASEDLPLSRLLRLSLFQVSVGMALVLLVGTLNRVMIVELHVPASIVSIMVAIPLLFAPFRALIGFRSDNHRSELRLAPRALYVDGVHGAVWWLGHHAVCIAGLGWGRAVSLRACLGGFGRCGYRISHGGCWTAHHTNRWLGFGQ
jgi:hypothetical protein